MTILLLRHAHAGDRGAWDTDDRKRPLSDRGEQQAAAVVTQYVGHPIDRILSSPLRRCVQTVEPLASARGLEVEEEAALAEGASMDLVRALLARVGQQTTVWCSHGDVIGMFLSDLRHRDVAFESDLRWQKASTWVLDGAPEIVRASYLQPPA